MKHRSLSEEISEKLSRVGSTNIKSEQSVAEEHLLKEIQNRQRKLKPSIWKSKVS